MGGITPNSWGPYMWGAIHLICLGAPEQIDSASQSAYASFFNQLPFVLPCATCGKHLQENLAKDPVEPNAGGKESLFAWSVRLHNTVNAQLGKSQMSLQDARKRWENVCLGENKDCASRPSDYASFSHLILFIAGVFIGVSIMYLWSSFRKGSRKS